VLPEEPSIQVAARRPAVSRSGNVAGRAPPEGEVSLLVLQGNPIVHDFINTDLRRPPMRRAITLTSGSMLVTVASAFGAFAAGMPMMMGPSQPIQQPSFQGYYDGHKDTYLSTDISSKAEATAMHINHSASIGRIKGLPEIYIVQGRSAAGQLAVFGSEPGEADYSPLWTETILTWKPGSKPVLITSDNQINRLEKTSGLTERPGNVVLNCPIVKVG
jgi:hypothetical protein